MKLTDDKMFKSKAKCLQCHKSMIYFKENKSKYKLCCSTYHKTGECFRNVWKNEEVQELLEMHQINLEDVKEMYLGLNFTYKIILSDNKEISFDGFTMLL